MGIVPERSPYRLTIITKSRTTIEVSRKVRELWSFKASIKVALFLAELGAPGGQDCSEQPRARRRPLNDRLIDSRESCARAVLLYAVWPGCLAWHSVSSLSLSVLHAAQLGVAGPCGGLPADKEYTGRHSCGRVATFGEYSTVK